MMLLTMMMKLKIAKYKFWDRKIKVCFCTYLVCVFSVYTVHMRAVTSMCELVCVEDGADAEWFPDRPEQHQLGDTDPAAAVGRDEPAAEEQTGRAWRAVAVCR